MDPDAYLPPEEEEGVLPAPGDPGDLTDAYNQAYPPPIDPGAAPPPLDENRGMLGRLPPQLVYQTLVDYGFRPEEAERFAQAPSYWDSAHREEAGRYSGPDRATETGQGVVSVNDLYAADPANLGRTVAHENIHRADDQSQGDYPTRAEMEALGATPAAGAVAKLQPRTGDPGLHGFHYDLTDPAHYTTGLAEGLDYDLTALPPDFAARQFPEMDYAQPSPHALRARGTPGLVIPENPDELAMMDLYYRQVPYFMSGEEPVDTGMVRAMDQGPPPIYGAGDTSVSDLGGYVDRETGEYVPFPRER